MKIMSKPTQGMQVFQARKMKAGTDFLMQLPTAPQETLLLLIITQNTHCSSERNTLKEKGRKYSQELRSELRRSSWWIN